MNGMPYIKVDLPSRSIAIYFRHPYVKKYIPTCDATIKEAVKRRQTVCSIFQADGTELKELSRATVNCYFKDNFDREQGRKRALARAFKFTNLSKDERTRIWQAYFARPATLLPREVVH